METRHFTSKRYQLLALLFLIFLNSCNFSGNFPLTVDDIDTLSIYKRHSDSLNVQKVAKLSDSIINSHKELKKQFFDSVTPPGKIYLNNKWTICTGAFKIKQNAERQFLSFKNQYQPYFFKRGSLCYITVGAFDTKDSANQFQKKFKSLAESYLMKIASSDAIFNQLPLE